MGFSLTLAIMSVTSDITSGTIVDRHITETNLLTLSNNVYLMFYAKEVDLGT